MDNMNSRIRSQMEQARIEREEQEQARQVALELSREQMNAHRDQVLAAIAKTRWKKPATLARRLLRYKMLNIAGSSPIQDVTSALARGNIRQAIIIGRNNAHAINKQSKFAHQLLVEVGICPNVESGK